MRKQLMLLLWVAVQTAVAATVAVAATSAGTGGGFAPARIAGWPRMQADAFGCMLEKELGYRDKQFNCSMPPLKAKDRGDPCHAIERYYAGPQLPSAMVRKFHPDIESIELAWEHGELQGVSIAFNKKMKKDVVEKMFGIDLVQSALPLMSADLQDCSRRASCLILQGFDHMGAGDVDCDVSADSTSRRSGH